MKKKFIKYNIGSIFDKNLIFGYDVGEDDYGNIKIKVTHRFCRTFVHYPRWFHWNPFFQKRVVMWYDQRDNVEDWNVKIGEVLTTPKKSDDWRLGISIEESTMAKAINLTREIDNALKIKGAWFGFP